MSRLLADPWFAAMLDGVIAQHRRCLTPHQIQAFRKQIAFTFETHPAARAILASSRPDLVRPASNRDTN